MLINRFFDAAKTTFLTCAQLVNPICNEYCLFCRCDRFLGVSKSTFLALLRPTSPDDAFYNDRCLFAGTSTMTVTLQSRHRLATMFSERSAYFSS